MTQPNPKATQPPTSPSNKTRIRRGRVAAKTIRLRDKDHRKFVSTQPCVVCGRSPADAHHLRFAQPRALGRKVSDEFTVPVCRVHHRELHRHGDEAAWWQRIKIDPLPIALGYGGTPGPMAQRWLLMEIPVGACCELQIARDMVQLRQDQIPAGRPEPSSIDDVVINH